VRSNTFDFRNDSTKLAYAATKLLISTVLLVVYWLVVKFGMQQGADEGKQIILLILFIGLTQYRDKFEKKIVSTYVPA
jgi:hypothetical protein